MPSIHDVAREAQVAPSTVSLVINGRSRVSHQTREKVLHAIQKIGYHPRPRGAQQPAAAAATSTTGTAARSSIKHLLVLVSRRAANSGEPDNLVNVWLTAIRDKSRGLNIHVSTHIGMDHVDHDPFFEAQLEDRSIDAVVLVKTMDSDGYLHRVLETGLPCLGMNQKPDNHQFNIITLDYRQSGHDIASRLLELGHKRFAFLGDRHRWTLDAIASGVEQALEDQGLSLLMDVSLNTTMPDVLQKTAVQLRKRQITAVVTFDPVAIQLLNLLESQGVKIPEELSIIGYDDLNLTSRGGLRLSSIGYNKSMMGTLAVQILVQQAQSESALRSSTLVMNTHSTQGDTVGPAPLSKDTSTTVKTEPVDA